MNNTFNTSRDNNKTPNGRGPFTKNDINQICQWHRPKTVTFHSGGEFFSHTNNPFYKPVMTVCVLQPKLFVAELQVELDEYLVISSREYRESAKHSSIRKKSFVSNPSLQSSTSDHIWSCRPARSQGIDRLLSYRWMVGVVVFIDYLLNIEWPLLCCASPPKGGVFCGAFI